MDCSALTFSQTKNLDGIVVVDLFDAIADARYSKLVRNYLARNANYHDKGLTALNTAFLQSGVFVLIPKNVKSESPLQITCVASGAEAGRASFPRLLIVAEENSSAQLVESYVSLGNQAYFTNVVVEVVVHGWSPSRTYATATRKRPGIPGCVDFC
jgi:Fe-S cluster assembly protein SufD